MDHALHDAHVAFQQHFRDLSEQIRRIHEEWQEAVRVHDIARQSALIDREHALVTEVHEVIATFQAAVAQRHQ
jgi:hypothetical protein